MLTDTPTIDCQVHAYDRNNDQNYRSVLAGPATVTGDEMVAAMDAVGVDGALLISPYTIYGYDSSYCEGVRDRHPNRFGLIKPFDLNAANLGAEVDAWAGRPGVVGARIVLSFEGVSADHPGLDQVLAAGARSGLPINVLCWDQLSVLAALARRHPQTQLVIDHVGLQQPFRSASAGRAVGGTRRGVVAGPVRQRGDQDFGRLHAVARAVPVLGHLGAVEPNLRGLRSRPLHVGHRLDPSDQPAHL